MSPQKIGLKSATGSVTLR